MRLTEPCNDCTGGVCGTCNGTGHELIERDGVIEPKYYGDDTLVPCNCTLPEAKGFGKCLYCGGTGTITRDVIDYEDPTLDELVDWNEQTDFEMDI